ncbi:claudin domain-containing protein 2-like isoform X2 [Gigantopelta aegis]|uniref:claudin domain-containing protein 2-like isoform X2 n=1 Tax=Gigantopelta aegis TaxID=1735272 RepID=UPI001B887D23|nr:claudin domain-containing protein 2-like isoform X2 [Gigantopelta aegis]
MTGTFEQKKIEKTEHKKRDKTEQKKREKDEPKKRAKDEPKKRAKDENEKKGKVKDENEKKKKSRRSRPSDKKYTTVLTNKRGVVAGVILLLIGLTLHVMGMATPNWVVQKWKYAGLWSEHSTWIMTYGQVSSLVTKPVPSWIRGVQAVAILGAVAAILSIVFLLISLKRPEKRVFIVSGVAAISAGFLIIVGVLTYGVQYLGWAKFSFSWAFFLEIAAGCIMIIAGFTILAVMTKQKYASKTLPADTSVKLLHHRRSVVTLKTRVVV